MWEDSRLTFNDTITEAESIVLPDDEINRVWVPDIFLENGKDEKLHTVTELNKEFRIYSNGTVYYSQR